ncbi:uncharacterized protein [Ptychodera flava]|uniref:uncharacterized protein n=1 Tax=Ptychodera flava TaxID=63121 RepID=UPI003969EF59
MHAGKIMAVNTSNGCKAKCPKQTYHIMDRYLREPWIQNVVGKTVLSNSYEEEINKATVAFVLKLFISVKGGPENAVAFGQLTDDDVIITALFSDVCVDTFEKEEEDKDFFLDLEDSVIIIKQYKVLASLDSNMLKSSFVLYINKITTWSLKEKKLCRPKLPQIMDIPAFRNMMTVVWSDAYKTTSDENSDSEASQLALSGAIEFAEELADEVPASKTGKDNAGNTRRNAENIADDYEDVQSPFSSQYEQPQGPDGLDYKDSEIPRNMLVRLKNIEEWKDDYCPPVTAHDPSSMSYSDTQRGQRLGDLPDSVDGLVSMMGSSSPMNPADYLEDCHLAMQTQLSSDISKSSGIASVHVLSEEKDSVQPECRSSDDDVIILSQTEMPAPLAQSTQINRRLESGKSTGKQTELQKQSPEAVHILSPKGFSESQHRSQTDFRNKFRKRKLQKEFEEVTNLKDNSRSRNKAHTAWEERPATGNGHCDDRLSDLQSTDTAERSDTSKSDVSTRGMRKSHRESSQMKITLKSPDVNVAESLDHSLPPYQPPRGSGQVSIPQYDDDFLEIQKSLLSVTFDLSWMKSYYLELGAKHGKT